MRGPVFLRIVNVAPLLSSGVLVPLSTMLLCEAKVIAIATLFWDAAGWIRSENLPPGGTGGAEIEPE